MKHPQYLRFWRGRLSKSLLYMACGLCLLAVVLTAGILSGERLSTRLWTQVGVQNQLLAQLQNVFVSRLSAAAALQVNDAQPLVTHTSISAEAPVIDNGRILWHDDRAGPTDIWRYDLATGSEFQVTLNPAAQLFPDLSGNLVVYEDNRNHSREQKNGWDIYAYNLETGQESALIQALHDQRYPRIWGDYLVYQDEGLDFGHSDVYLYQISTATLTPLAVADGYQGRPDIDNGWVTWIDRRGGTAQIGLYNIGTSEQRFHPAPCRGPCEPRINGRELVWSDDRNGSHDLFMLDLETGVETTLYAAPGDQLYPVLSDALVAWQDRTTNHNWDIFAQVRASGAIFPVTRNSSRQIRPAVEGNVIVWQDNRSHTWDIYGFEWQGNVPVDPGGDLLVPSELMVGAGPNATLQLAWQHETPAEQFVIQRAVGIFGTDWQELATIPGNQLSYVDANVQLGQSYWYRVSAVVGGQQSTPSNESYSTVVDGALSADERYLHVLINEARLDPARWGYPELAPVLPTGWDPLLALSVQAHADGMNNSHCCQGHIDLEGRNPSERAEASGFPYFAGENLSQAQTGTGSMEAVHQGFMDSDGHRAALMDPNARLAAVGVAPGGRGTVAEVFSAGPAGVEIGALPTGAVTPGVGSIATLFTFVVTFWNVEKLPPTRAEVVIDGVAHALALRSGAPGAGTYQLEMPLSEGAHQYYFEFAWGQAGQVARLPATGSLAEPNVAPLSAELRADGLDQVQAIKDHQGWLRGAVTNLGDVGAQNVVVHFYAGNPLQGGQLIGKDLIENLPPNQMAQAKAQWTPLTAGIETIYMWVNPRHIVGEEIDTEIAEPDKTNNLSSLNINVRAAGGATWYVDASAPEGGDGRAPQAALRTIGEALTRAGAGDTVLVAAGVYTGGIRVPMGVHLAGAGWETTAIKAPAAGPIVMLEDESQLSGFSLRGANAQLWDAGAWILPEATVRVTHNYFAENSKGVVNICFECVQPCDTTSQIANNIIVHNKDTGVDTHCPDALINNTIAFNVTGVYVEASDAHMRNNIVAENETGMNAQNIQMVAAYNNVWGNGVDYRGGAPGENALSVNPNFVNVDAADFHLQPGSLCIDAGDPDAAYLDADGTRNDMGAYGGAVYQVPTPLSTPVATPQPTETVTPSPTSPPALEDPVSHLYLPITRR